MGTSDHAVIARIIQDAGGFGHREHVELAWSYLQMYDTDRAAEAMVAAIRHLAEVHGAQGKFHETITRGWLHCVAVHDQRWGAADFDTFLQRNPDLLDRTLLGHFYSRELIGSEDARASFREPDLRALPVLA
ncbi:MAG TPA: hypothetical protein VMF07_21550 [Solirubrobacteraceae bacterium]|nr:hypothetical protein [Solirubrobacteraceae bacterium]